MLPLWRDQLKIILSPDKLILTRFAKGLRPQISEEKSISLTAIQNPSWQSAIEALPELIAPYQDKSADVTVVLSNHFVRYQVLPWNEQIKNRHEELAFARIGFEKTYGDIATQWDIRVSDEGYGQARLATAIDQELSQKIISCLNQTKLRLISIQPYLMVIFSHRRNHIKDKDYLLGIQEAGKLCLISVQNGQWHDVQSVRINVELKGDELAGLIERQCLTIGLSPANKIYIYTPEESAFILPKALNAERLNIDAATIKQYGIDYGKKISDDRTGRAVFALSLVLVVYFGYVYSQLNTVKMRWQTQRPQVTSANGSPRVMQASAQFNNAKELVRRLTLPWDNLFESIEVSAQEKVALLNIQPDVQKGSVLIVAEAKNYDDMLGYTKRLSKTALKDVHILNHQIQRREPGQPVRFTVTAFWLNAK